MYVVFPTKSVSHHISKLEQFYVVWVWKFAILTITSNIQVRAGLDGMGSEKLQF